MKFNIKRQILIKPHWIFAVACNGRWKRQVSHNTAQQLHEVHYFTILLVQNRVIISWYGFITRKTDFVAFEQPHGRPACASAQPDKCFAICSLESIITKIAACKISIFKLVSIAVQASLSLMWSQIGKAGVLVRRPNYTQYNAVNMLLLSAPVKAAFKA